MGYSKVIPIIISLILTIPCLLMYLSFQVTVINAFSHEVIPELRTNYNLETLDMVFLDHFKANYAADLQAIEKSGLLHNGSVAFADNVEEEGAPGFSQYIRSSGKYECQFYGVGTEYVGTEYAASHPDGMERGIFKGADM